MNKSPADVKGLTAPSSGRGPLSPSGSLDQIVTELLRDLSGRRSASKRKLLTDEQVEALAIRGKFEDRRRNAGDRAQMALDQMNRTGMIVRTLYLARESALRSTQIEAAFAIALRPDKRIAVLLPVPIAGNAKIAEVANVRWSTAGAMLNKAYEADWQLFFLSTEGRLDDRDVLGDLGVRFPDEVTVDDMAALAAMFGVNVEIGIPAPAGQLVKVRRGGSNLFSKAIQSLKHLLPLAPRTSVRAHVDVKWGVNSEPLSVAPSGDNRQDQIPKLDAGE